MRAPVEREELEYAQATRVVVQLVSLMERLLVEVGRETWFELGSHDLVELGVEDQVGVAAKDDDQRLCLERSGNASKLPREEFVRRVPMRYWF